MNVRELLTKLGFEVDHKPLDHVEEQLEGIKHRLEFLAAAEVLHMLFELGEKFANMGEKIAVASQSAGISVEAFQKLTYAAQQSAVSSDEMETAMARLSRRLYDAKHGSGEATKAFQAVGITGDQIARFKTSEEAMAALSDRFAKINDPIKKAALAQELMGRGSIHMVGFLSKGSAAIRQQGEEAERLGLILGHNQVENLEKLELSFHKLFGFLKAFGADIASYIAPVFSFMIDDFLKWYKINKDIIGVNIKNFLNTFAYGLGFVWGAVKILIGALIDLAKRFHMEGAILPMIAKFAGFVSALLLVIKVVRIAQTVFSTLAALFSPLAIAIGLIVVAVHDLYAAFTGQKTWMDSLFEMLGIAQQVQDVFFTIFETVDKVGGAISGVAGSIGRFIGLGGSKVEAMNSPGAAASTIQNTSNKSIGGDTTSVNAPITINVPQGANPQEVGTKVREGVRDHLDRMKREAGRSTLSPVAY